MTQHNPNHTPDQEHLDFLIHERQILKLLYIQAKHVTLCFRILGATAGLFCLYLLGQLLILWF